VETTVATTIATTTQTDTAVHSESPLTQAPTQANGTPVSFENVSFVIPSELAASANTETMTSVTSNSGAPWEVVPTHLRFTLTGYQLQGKFHEPRILVYPAEEYANLNSNAAEQIENIKKILAGATILKETFPRIPGFNAEPLIAAHIQLLPFQNGSGIRWLTQYAQYAAPINNNELFYNFDGLTDDGKFYVIAILPVNAPILAADEKPEATVPEGGVPIPTDIGVNNIYYISITERLNSLTPDAYTPSLNTLDTLIQSILVKNP
jgi:hypothetical protein